VEHTSGVHGQARDADRRAILNSQLGENAWAFFLYPDILMDLQMIIEKGSPGGSEEGNWHNLGIAQVLMAYSMFVITDTWGRVPYSEAFLGSEDRYPVFDTQESIYTEMLSMLDDAIANFQKESTSSPGGEDFIYGGDLDAWTKAAYALKARYSNRLSKRSPAQSAADALTAAENAFSSNADNFTFDNYGPEGNYQNPWFKLELERGHHALSQTLYDILDGMNDLRQLLFIEVLGPNGRVEVCGLNNLEGTGRPDPIDVTQRILRCLVIRYIHTCHTRHMFVLLAPGLTLTLLMFRIRANHPHNAFPANDLAILTNSLD